MTTITVSTHISAPIQSVFDLSRDIDFHKKSASQTQETAIAGVTSGLIQAGQTVTWGGKHFGLWLTHTSIISAFEPPSYFVDEMTEGRFKSFRHEHYFEEQENATVMKDVLYYETPFGLFGKLFDKLFLEKHMCDFIKTRNHSLKTHLERAFQKVSLVQQPL